MMAVLMAIGWGTEVEGAEGYVVVVLDDVDTRESPEMGISFAVESTAQYLLEHCC